MYKWISRFFWYWEEERFVNIVDVGKDNINEKVESVVLKNKHAHKSLKKKATTHSAPPKKRLLKKASLPRKAKYDTIPLKNTPVPIPDKRTKHPPIIKESDTIPLKKTPVPIPDKRTKHPPIIEESDTIPLKKTPVPISDMKHVPIIKEPDPIIDKKSKITIIETSNNKISAPTPQKDTEKTVLENKDDSFPIYEQEKETVPHQDHNTSFVKKEETTHENDTFFQPIKKKVSFREMTTLFQKFSKVLSDHNTPDTFPSVMDQQFKVSYGTYARGLDSDSCDENDLTDLILDTMESIMPGESDDNDEISIDMTPPIPSMKQDSPLDVTPVTSLTKEDVQIPTPRVTNDENDPTIHEEFSEYIKKYKSILSALKSKYRNTGDIEARICQFCAATGSTLVLIEKTAKYIETTTDHLLKMLQEERKNTLPQSSTIRESIIKRSNDVFDFLICLKKFNQKLIDNLNNAREVLGKIDSILTHFSKIEFFPAEDIKACLVDIGELCKFIDSERTERIKKLSKVGKERHGELFKEYKKKFDHRKKVNLLPEKQPTSVKDYLTNKYLKM